MDALPMLLGSRAAARAPEEPVKRRRPTPVALEIPEEEPAAAAQPQLRVKNTFLECAAQRSPGSESLRRRRVPQTCPSKHSGRLVSLMDELAAVSGGADIPATPPPGLPTPCNIQTPTADSLIPEPVLPPWWPMPHAYQGFAPGSLLPPAGLDPQPAAQHVSYAPRPVLSLVDALDPCAALLPMEPYAGMAPWPLAAMQPQPHDIDFLGAPAPTQGICTTTAAWTPAPVSPPRRLAPTAAELDSSRSSLGSGLEDLTAPTQPPSPPPGPAPGSLELPSVGSAGHGAGSCKPCAFLHTKGCETGLACQFCHLCGPEEKRMRRKQKLQQQRESMRARKDKQAAAAAAATAAVEADPVDAA